MTTILVIEDEPTIRENIADTLSIGGFEAMSAENGVLGLQMARQYLPDLIICDVTMPELDGFGVLLDLHSDPATAMIPFIFLTARVDKTTVRMGMELGADDFLTKPFTASELLAAVTVRLERHNIITSSYEKRIETLRGNLLHMLPHELRTPLTAVIGYSDMLISDSEKLAPERIAIMGQRINKAALRLFHLVENFLLYTQLEVLKPDSGWADKIREATTPKPKELIESAVIGVTERAEHIERAADMSMDITDCKALQIAPDSLKKIVEELVDNAFKFSKAGQAVYISGRSLDKQYYQLWVLDHGRGMTPEQIAEVGAYMQFDRHMYEQQGTGLGLIIVRKLIELFKGNLEVQSTPNESTTVTVTLPIAR